MVVIGLVEARFWDVVVIGLVEAIIGLVEARFWEKNVVVNCILVL